MMTSSVFMPEQLAFAAVHETLLSINVYVVLTALDLKSRQGDTVSGKKKYTRCVDFYNSVLIERKTAEIVRYHCLQPLLQL